MQNINILNLKHIRFIALIIVAIAVIVAVGLTTANVDGTTFAFAEDAAISDASELHTVLRNNGDLGEVGGVFTLDADIVIPLSSGFSTATFTGSLDGKGHTITFTGTSEYFFDKDNPGAATNHIVGLLFGQLGEGATIRNVNIVLDGAVRFVAYNSKSTSGGISYTAASTTLYAGVIAGGSTKANVRDVSLTITQTGAIAAIGIDNNDSASSYAGGQGAILGGMVGSSAGTTFYNVSLNNQGSIFARGDNKNAGETGSDGNVINGSVITNPDRAVAGGIVGEVVTISNATNTINNLLLQGNGYLGAAASGDNGISEATSHNINFAGGIFGLEQKTGSTATSYVVNNSSYKVFVTRQALSDPYSFYAGTLFGYSLSAKVSYMWYQSNGAVTQASRGVAYYDNTSTTPTYNTLLSSITLTLVNNNFETCAIGSGILSNQSPRAYNATGYKGSQANADVGSATVVDVKNGNLTIFAQANGDHYISAISSGNHNRPTNIYKDGSLQKSATLTNYPISATATDFRVYFATISSGITYNVTGITGSTKVFDEAGLYFTGYPVGALTINDNLCWGYTWTNTDGINTFTTTTYGELGKTVLSTFAHAGNYEIALYRFENGEYIKVKNGESIGANADNAPSVVYMHTGAVYNYSITPAPVYIQVGSTSYLNKEYDGTFLADASLLNSVSFGLYYDSEFYNRASDTNYIFSFSSGVFGKVVNDSFITGYTDVGDDYVVRFSGLSLALTENGYCNYKFENNDVSITISNCSITQRQIYLTWNNVDDQNKISVIYNGGFATPDYTLNNVVDGETITPQFEIYDSNLTLIPTSFNTKLQVGEYYILPILSNSSNYYINAARQPYTIVPKEIDLDWTPFSQTFDTIEKHVNVKPASGFIYNTDSVNVNVQYVNLSNDLITAYINDAGQYRATASLDNANYVISSAYISFDDIYVSPAKINVNVGSELLYKGINYASLDPNSENALFVTVLEPALGVLKSNVVLSYNTNEVKNVGNYTVTLSLKSTDTSLINPDNYVIVNPTRSVKINPRKVIPEFSHTSSVYDRNAKSVTLSYRTDYSGIANADQYGIVNGDIITTSQSVTFNGEIVREVVDAGDYVYTYTLNTANYLFVKADNLNNPSTTINFNYTVTPLDIDNESIKVGDLVDKEYTGSAIAPEIALYLNNFNGYKLLEGIDYVVTTLNSEDYVGVGTATFTIEGRGNYTKTKSCTFNIVPKLISVDYSKVSSSFTYTGTSHSILPELSGIVYGDTAPEFTVKYQKDGVDIDPSAVVYIGNYVAITSLKGSLLNYKLPTEGNDFAFRIIPKGVEITFSNYSGFVYNGTTQFVTAGFKPGAAVYDVDNTDVSVQINYYLADSYTGRETDVPVMPIEAKTYVAVPSLIGSSIKENYNIVNTTNLTFSIEKYQVDLRYYYKDNVVPVYNANVQTIICEIKDDNNELSQILSNSGLTLYPIVGYLHKATSMSVQDNKPILAGEYIAYASLSDQVNFKINPDTVYADFVINRATLTASLFTNIADRSREYIYNGSNIAPSYTVTGSVESISISLDVNFFDTDHRPIFECINVGNYLVSLTLPNESWASNYILVDPNGIDTTSLEYQLVSILPRSVAVEFNFNATQDYNAQEQVVYADLKNVAGELPGTVIQGNGSKLEGSGLVEGEVISFVINRFKYDGSTRVELTDDDVVRNVGKYSFDAYIDNNPNYVIYNNGQKVEYISGDMQITPYELTFIANNITKKYGDSDNDVDFTQRIAGLEGESVVVTLERDRNPDNYTGRDVEAVYDMYLFVKFTWDDQNYKVTRPSNTDGYFQIVKREVEFEVPEFTFYYLDHDFSAEPTLTYTIEVATVVFGTINVTISLTPEGTPVNSGVYSFNRTHDVDDNESIITTMKEGSNLNKIVILGRTVVVNFQDFAITYGQYEPYNGIDDNGAYNKSNYFDYFSISNNDVGLKKCHDEIVNAYNESDDQANFPWWNYIEIIREKVPGTLIYDENIGLLPYKDSGYQLTVRFKEEAGGDNYSAIKADGSAAIYTLTVNKFDLGTLFSADKNYPVVETIKDYDQTITARIVSENNGYNGSSTSDVITSQINTALRGQGLYPTAVYEDKNAGKDKIIKISYLFRVPEISANYILPETFEYPQKGTIKALDVDVELTVDKNELTYGEIPTISVKYSGFLPNDETINDFKLCGLYEDGTALDVIQNVSDAYGYTIILRPEGEIALQNYNILYEADSAKAIVIINPKDIALVATGIKYDKLIDGSYVSDVQVGTHMVLDGLLDGDVVNIVFDQILKDKEVGETEVIVDDIRIDNANYNLITTKLNIAATIRNLANVTLDNVTVDFDNTAKALVPEINYEDATTANQIETEILYSGVYYDESEEAPINAGVYNVRVFLRYKQYRSLFATATLIINKIAPKLSFSGEMVQTYGSFTKVTATVSAIGLEVEVPVHYSFEVAGAEFPEFPQAGKHTVTASYAETNNYLAVSGDEYLQIKAKSITVTFSNYKELVYNGYSRESDIGVTLNGIVEGDTCDPIKQFDALQVKNAGTYRLTITPSNTSYTISGSNSVQFTIGKKKLTVSVEEGITTTAGVAPKFTIIYDGFVENEDENDLTVKPSVQAKSGQVGTNLVEYNEGSDENYYFDYKLGVYTITYEPKQDANKNITPYVVGGSIAGGIGLVTALGFAVRAMNFRRVVNGSTKRAIKKSMMRKK